MLACSFRTCDLVTADVLFPHLACVTVQPVFLDGKPVQNQFTARPRTASHRVAIAAKAADGKRLHKLEPDPGTARVVRRIFAEYLAGRGLFAIAEGLTRDGIPSCGARKCDSDGELRFRSGVGR